MRAAPALAAEFALGLAVLGGIVAVGHEEVAGLGLTGTALLMLLPVLWIAARTDAALGAAMALIAAGSLNFFLLPPRYSLAIDGPTYVVIFLVFGAVALVTGGFAAGLRAQKDEAAARAADSAFEAEFLAAMALAVDRADLDRRAGAFLAERHGEARLFSRADLADRATGLAPLDAAAAVWALDHDTVTGHASDVMPAADYRFLSFGRGSDEVLALPTHSAARDQSAASLARIAGYWGRARDRLDSAAERQRREEAEFRDTTRRAMLAALGHDFRTPLTVLKEGLAHLPGAQEAGLTREVERLRTLGENLLASARLDAGLPLAVEAVDLVDALAGLDRRAETAAPGVAYAVAVPADAPLVRAEPVMLHHLLGNLVENAARHAAARVCVTVHEDEDGVTLRVGDDGPGIPPELAETMFEPGVTTRHETRASGFGLAIARDLATAMGARLWLDTGKPRGGAVFAVRLPLAEGGGPPA